MAKWNGTSWSALGSGVNNTVNALAVFNDGSGPALYAGGSFTTAGGATANRIAKWNGTTWSALGTGMAGGTIPTVRALKVHNDGTGSALYVGGDFTSAGGKPSAYIARWASRQTGPDVVQSPVEQTKSVGETAAFSVTASGTGTMSYQWRRGGSPIFDDDRISGATSVTLTISPVGVSDAGSYDVVVTNACGSDTSDPATLTVNCAPTFPTDLDSDCDVDADDLAAFELCMSGPAVPTDPDCASRDPYDDDDVDLDDYGGFQRCYCGQNIVPDPGCVN